MVLLPSLAAPQNCYWLTMSGEEPVPYDQRFRFPPVWHHREAQGWRHTASCAMATLATLQHHDAIRIASFSSEILGWEQNIFFFRVATKTTKCCSIVLVLVFNMFKKLCLLIYIIKTQRNPWFGTYSKKSRRLWTSGEWLENFYGKLGGQYSSTIVQMGRVLLWGLAGIPCGVGWQHLLHLGGECSNIARHSSPNPGVKQH